MVWDLRAGARGATLAGHEGVVYSAALSADGQVGVSASADRTCIVWDVEAGTSLRRLRGHDGIVRGCAVSARAGVAAAPRRSPSGIGGSSGRAIVTQISPRSACHWALSSAPHQLCHQLLQPLQPFRHVEDPAVHGSAGCGVSGDTTVQGS